MQGSNCTYKKPPRPKDGTLQKTKAEPEANWFGQATEPQEEYMESAVRPPDPGQDEAVMSEGEPTFTSLDVFSQTKLKCERVL
jgi:hypothetical protein